MNNRANANTIYTEYGSTYLAISCSLGLFDISELLIQFGADVNGVNMPDEDYQRYPIIEAVRSNNMKFSTLYIKINIRNKQGEST